MKKDENFKAILSIGLAVLLSMILIGISIGTKTQ